MLGCHGCQMCQDLAHRHCQKLLQNIGIYLDDGHFQTGHGLERGKCRLEMFETEYAGHIDEINKNAANDLQNVQPKHLLPKHPLTSHLGLINDIMKLKLVCKLTTLPTSIVER